MAFSGDPSTSFLAAFDLTAATRIQNWPQCCWINIPTMPSTSHPRQCWVGELGPDSFGQFLWHDMTQNHRLVDLYYKTPTLWDVFLYLASCTWINEQIVCHSNSNQVVAMLVSVRRLVSWELGFLQIERTLRPFLNFPGDRLSETPSARTVCINLRKPISLDPWLRFLTNCLCQLCPFGMIGVSISPKMAAAWGRCWRPGRRAVVTWVSYWSWRGATQVTSRKSRGGILAANGGSSGLWWIINQYPNIVLTSSWWIFVFVLRLFGFKVLADAHEPCWTEGINRCRGKKSSVDQEEPEILQLLRESS